MNILITGATSGIGRQLAVDYHRDGHEVCALGRNAQALEELQTQGIATGKVDLTDRTGALAWFRDLQSIDIAILNAGTCEYIDLPEFDSALVQRVMRANVESAAICIEGVLPLLQKSEHPQLVLMGSSAAYLPLPRSEAYGASKAAIAYMAESLRVDLYKEIAVSLVCPGFIKTPLTDKNDFPMPFLTDVKQASKCIRNGIKKQKAEIHFPKRFTLLLKIFRVLPRYAWVRLAQLMVRT